MDIKIIKTAKPKNKPDWNNLGFGNIFTDHMFLMNYSGDKGWHDARIVPFENLEFSPAMIALHYGQMVFEGTKAYKTENGDIQLFRPQNHLSRMNNSNRRLCIPEINEAFCLKAICELVKMEQDWIPKKPGTSLYLRPFVFGTEETLMVHPSSTYTFAIICSPCGAYYPEGINPVKIHIETEAVRAVKGGTGDAKTGGNYAASFQAQKGAERKGYSQVLWLDGRERKYIEEVGAMNVFFVIDSEIITPKLEGSILPGVTRLSVIEILKDKGYNVAERRISVDELIESAKKGSLKEAFGTGTAAVISPIGELSYNDENFEVNARQIGKISQELYDELTSIQYGNTKDNRGWVVQV